MVEKKFMKMLGREWGYMYKSYRTSDYLLELLSSRVLLGAICVRCKLAYKLVSSRNIEKKPQFDQTNVFKCLRLIDIKKISMQAELVEN